MKAGFPCQRFTFGGNNITVLLSVTINLWKPIPLESDGAISFPGETCNAVLNMW